MALAWPLSAPSVDSTVIMAVPARAATSVMPLRTGLRIACPARS